MLAAISPTRSRSLRLVRVCLDYVPESGGTYTSGRNFAEALATQHLVNTVSFTSQQFKDNLPALNSVTRVPVVTGTFGQMYSWSTPRYLRMVRREIARADLVIIHMLYRFHAQWASARAKEFDIPVIVVPHGSLDPYVFTYRSWRKKLWLRVLGPGLIGRSSCVLFATERERAKARPHLFGAQSAVIAWPVRAPTKIDREAAAVTVKKRLGIPSEDRLLLYLGRLHPSKRPIETIEAFSKVEASNWHLIVAGPDSPEIIDANIGAVVKTDKDRVHMIGPVYGEEKHQLFEAADAYVLLSHKENFGYTVAEALSCGTPVLISNGVDLCDAVDQHQCGWVVNANDDNSRVQAIHDLCGSDPNRLRQMGEAGRKWVQHELSFDLFRS